MSHLPEDEEDDRVLQDSDTDEDLERRPDVLVAFNTEVVLCAYEPCGRLMRDGDPKWVIVYCENDREKYELYHRKCLRRKRAVSRASALSMVETYAMRFNPDDLLTVGWFHTWITTTRAVLRLVPAYTIVKNSEFQGGFRGSEARERKEAEDQGPRALAEWEAEYERQRFWTPASFHAVCTRSVMSEVQHRVPHLEWLLATFTVHFEDVAHMLHTMGEVEQKAEWIFGVVASSSAGLPTEFKTLSWFKDPHGPSYTAVVLAATRYGGARGDARFFMSKVNTILGHVRKGVRGPRAPTHYESMDAPVRLSTLYEAEESKITENVVLYFNAQDEGMGNTAYVIVKSWNDRGPAETNVARLFTAHGRWYPVFVQTDKGYQGLKNWCESTGTVMDVNPTKVSRATVAASLAYAKRRSRASVPGKHSRR